MTQSTDAILFYGYHFPEDVELPDEVHELWGNDEPVLVGSHCSGDYPMYYVYIQESRTLASRGYPKEIKTIIAEDHWPDLLITFAMKHGVDLPGTNLGEYEGEVSELGWWLVSNWN